ncbi:hypothetical protein Bca4012_020390 [Brassica carinata]|uniref:Uncharacterized protein n=1 Tax=Brassica carinata TaxID=52824 RepID=A0A8X7WGZ5_BRACI|nr:hypothetical protein Bca52824_001241 [Brassica carinata]
MLISTWMCVGRMRGSASPRGTGRMDKRRYARPQGRGTSTPHGNRRLVWEPERAALNAREGMIGTREVRGLVCAGWIHRVGSELSGHTDHAGVYTRDG